MEQLLGALPVHLLAVLLERQAPAATFVTGDSRPPSADAEPGSAAPAVTGGQPALDGGLKLPAVYLKKGLVALSHLADLAARTPLAKTLEVTHISHVCDAVSPPHERRHSKD